MRIGLEIAIVLFLNSYCCIMVGIHSAMHRGWPHAPEAHSHCPSISAIGMTGGLMITMNERKERLTGTSTGTASSATFRVSGLAGEQPLRPPVRESSAVKLRWEEGVLMLKPALAGPVVSLLWTSQLLI